MEKNIGGLRLNVTVINIDEALEKVNKLNTLLSEANSLKEELARTEVTIQFVSAIPEQE